MPKSQRRGGKTATRDRIYRELEREPLPETDAELAKRLGLSRQIVNGHLQQMKDEGVLLGRACARLPLKLFAFRACVMVKLRKGRGAGALIAKFGTILAASPAVEAHCAVTGTTDFIIFLRHEVGRTTVQRLLLELTEAGAKTETFALAGPTFRSDPSC